MRFTPGERAARRVSDVRLPRHARPVRRTKRWEPAATDRELLTEHLFYEIQMTFFLAGQINSQAGSRVDISLLNGQIEAFDMHLVQLLEFFWRERQRTGAHRDAFAADYFEDGEWARLRPELPPILEKALRQHGSWGTTSLTYDRAWVRPVDKVWDVVTQAFALATVVERFVATVDHSQFTPGYANGMRMCAEVFVSGKRGSARAA
jgi:hypothetical protein